MEEVNPLVSIIVPNYNHEKFLKQRLESIFNQTYCNFEVILLDDCSTDASLNILSEYAKNPKVSHCVFNETNSGNTFIQWNKGIALAKGDFIWIAESDDFCELNFLEELIQPVLEDPEIKLVYCQSNRVDEMGVIKGNWLHHTDNLDTSLFKTNFVMDGNKFIELFLIHKNVIPNASGVLFQKAKAVQLGELDIDPMLKTSGDWLFYLKMVTNNKVAFIPKSLNNFRQHSTSVIAKLINTDNQITIIDFELKVRKKMTSFLSIFKANNYINVLNINRKIAKEITYSKAIFYIKNDNKIRGGLILLTVLDIFFRKSTFIKKFRVAGSK
nr:glycosyltransferase family 2 protein [uncultured Flavobacterium sp.]